MLIPSLALISLIAPTAAPLAQEESRRVRVLVRDEAEPGRDGELVIAEPMDRDERERSERRLAIAERLLDRAAVELERERPNRAMALIRAARRVLREPTAREEGVGRRRRVEERRVEARSEARAEPPAEGRGTMRVEIRTRTRGEGGQEEEKVEVREFRIGPDGKIQSEEGDEGGASVRVAPDSGMVQAIRELERLTRDLRAPAVSEVAPPAEETKPEAVAEPNPEPAEGEKPVGIGVLLEEEDGEFVVRSVLPDGPAASEGSIGEGDRLVGVYDAEGEAVMFEGKALPEVVGMIRGEAGTPIKLIVMPAGSEERREVELVRQALRVPEGE
jgi:hypothetical protein